jgi:PKD repeat protein
MSGTGFLPLIGRVRNRLLPGRGFAAAQVGPPPGTLTVDLSAQPENVVSGQPVTFNASASGGNAPYTYVWDFGDGTTGVGPQVSHAYTAQQGTFTATVVATDVTGDTGFASQAIGVGGVIVTTQGDVTTYVGIAVTFQAQVSGDVPPCSFTWDFGDGSAGSQPTTGQTVSHFFDRPGTYLVTVSVSCEQGSGTAQDTVDVLSPSSPLTLAADLTPTVLSPGQTVDGTAQASGGQQPYSYEWDFGDGGTSNSADASHTYDLSGSYNATVTVTDHTGATQVGSWTVVVSSNFEVTIVVLGPGGESGGSGGSS